MRAHLIDVVQRGDARCALRRASDGSGDEILDRLGVDGAERLVEQDEGRVLQQQAREQHALELSTREGADAAIAKILQAERREALRRPRPAGRCVEPAPGADRRARAPWPRSRTP